MAKKKIEVVIEPKEEEEFTPQPLPKKPLGTNQDDGTWEHD